MKTVKELFETNTNSGDPLDAYSGLMSEEEFNLALREHHKEVIDIAENEIKIAEKYEKESCNGNEQYFKGKIFAYSHISELLGWKRS